MGNLYTKSKLTRNDREEVLELVLLEGISVKEAKNYILERKETERVRRLNNLILCGNNIN